MLRFGLHMEFAPQHSEETAAVLRALVGPVRSVPGCCTTRFLRDDDGTRMTWIEEWRSIEDFEQRLESPTFRRILAVIDLAVAPPLVEIDDVAWRRGFDLIEEILSQTRKTEQLSGRA